MVNYLRPNVVTAILGTNVVTQAILVGKHLRVANLRNLTKNWNLCSLSLADADNLLSTQTETISLVQRVQLGNKDVAWQGDVLIEEPHRFVKAIFYRCDADDKLYLTVGYD